MRALSKTIWADQSAVLVRRVEEAPSVAKRNEVTDKVQAFGVERANNTRRDAVWKSDFDAVVAELADQMRVHMLDVDRIRALEADRDQISLTLAVAKADRDKWFDRARVLESALAQWRRGCTGKHGSQDPCVVANIDLPQSETKPRCIHGFHRHDECGFGMETPVPDEDGRCTRCGCEFEDPKETTHECPPGFTKETDVKS